MLPGLKIELSYLDIEFRILNIQGISQYKTNFMAIRSWSPFLHSPTTTYPLQWKYVEQRSGVNEWSKGVKVGVKKIGKSFSA